MSLRTLGTGCQLTTTLTPTQKDSQYSSDGPLQRDSREVCKSWFEDVSRGANYKRSQRMSEETKRLRDRVRELTGWEPPEDDPDDTPVFPW